MRLHKRQNDILEAVKLSGACSITELASQLGVSDETIRRNIKPLVLEGLVDKVHGGIVLGEDLAAEQPFERRMRKNVAEKKTISTLVAQVIRDGDSIILDTGSTTTYVARALKNKADLSVVTNCTEIGRTLAHDSSNRVHICGGILRNDDWATFGPSAISFVKQFHVSYAILSIGAVSSNGDFTDFHLEEAEFSRAVIDQARKVIVAVDHTKFGNSNFVRVCNPEQVDMVVTDRQPPVEIQARFNEAGVEVITPQSP